MKLIDRYIARQYLTNILALLAILFSFVVTIDASINIDEFWEAAGEPTADGEEPGLVRRVTLTALWIAHLWWPRLLQLFNMMLGIVLVGAMGFTCVQLVRHRETVAVLASGLSLRRVAAPILGVSLFMVGLAAVNQEAVLPRVAKLLTREHRDLGTREATAGPIPLATGNQGQLLIYAARFDADRAVLEDALFIQRDPAGPGTLHITTELATWDTTALAWTAESASVEDLISPENSSAGEPVSIETDLDPTALTVLQYAGFSQNLSFRQIGRLLNQTRGGDANVRERLQRNRFGRIAMALSNLLIIVIALPFFLTRMPGNSLTGSLRGAPVAVACIIGATLGTSAPVPGVPAVVSVFLPVLVLAPLAIAVAISPKT
ncbi:MAG: LptF/LptG family permease [Planctomycetota bacterium]